MNDNAMITGSKIILREKRMTDAEDDYAWETDPELAQLDAAPVMDISYSYFLSGFASQLHNIPPTSHRFAIDTLDGKHIGNCSYHNISETNGETELGIMIGNRDYWDSGYGTDVVTTLVNHVFRQTNLNRIYLKTLESNTRAQKCFQKCGFTPYDRLSTDGFRFELMEIHRDQWQKQQTAS